MVFHILRLGHRPSRDKRITTHLILAARAFGASGASYSGNKDSTLEETIAKIVSNWGGTFNLEYSESWRKLISDWEGKVIHLTMYGLPFQDVIEGINKCKKNLLILVGSEKIPTEVYYISDWNIAITNQPHSEVAALAVFLDKFFEGKKLKRKFQSSKIKIIPQKKGKKLKKLNEK